MNCWPPVDSGKQWADDDVESSAYEPWRITSFRRACDSRDFLFCAPENPVVAFSSGKFVRNCHQKSTGNLGNLSIIGQNQQGYFNGVLTFHTFAFMTSNTKGNLNEWFREKMQASTSMLQRYNLGHYSNVSVYFRH